ncbi:MAG: MotA/TolQ/ExbB proton channel family protein [Fibrobacterota bacterium]
MKYIIEGFQGPGAFFMWVIVITALICIGLVIERIFYLVIKSGLKRASFMADIQKIIKKGNIDAGIKYSAKSTLPLAKIVNTILVNREKGEKEVNKAVDEVFLTEVPKLNRVTPLLNTFANVATLAGLLGTIYGLLLAFDAVANVAAAQRAQALATGIAVAMATTFAGLCVAIPTILAHGILTSYTDKLIEEIDEKGAKLVNLVVS